MTTRPRELLTPAAADSLPPRRGRGWLLVGAGVVLPSAMALLWWFWGRPWRAPVLAGRVLEWAPVWGAAALVLLTCGLVLLRTGRRGIAVMVVLAVAWLAGTVVLRPFAADSTLTSPNADLVLNVRPLPLGRKFDRQINLVEQRGVWSQLVTLGCLGKAQDVDVEWVAADQVRLTLLEDGRPVGPPSTYQAAYGSQMMYVVPVVGTRLPSC
ncbi:hypothetical protein [Aestuariimicrobium sp. Y1814]|uniref:hypothetical protein n=1 Tax=Aestuariimicrobium sp. Y1814 TaxID=3418742 RepID=UPI003DA6FB44